MLSRVWWGRSLLASLPAVSVPHSSVHHHAERGDLALFLSIKRSNRARANRNTHQNERMFRRMRGRKTLTIELPDDAEERYRNTLNPFQLRKEMLKKGVNPYREVQPMTWREAEMTMQSFNAVVDPYVTREDSLPWLGQGAVFEGFKAKGYEFKDGLMHKWHNWRNGTSRIKKKEGFEKFDTKAFASSADSIYVEAHSALMARNKKRLHGLITEHAFLKMWPDVERGSIRWEMLEQLSPSRVVAVRCSDNPYQSGNDIAQVTVRMHSKQMLAVYDRFGRVVLGSESEPREVVEYVIFENHIAVVDGKWRLHAKVHPGWAPAKDGLLLSSALPPNSVRPSAPTALPLRAQDLHEKAKAEESSKS